MATYESLLESAVAHAMANVQRMGIDELKALINDDEKIDELVKDMPQVKHLSREKEMLLAQNKSLAEWNLSQEPKLRETKVRLIESFEQAAKLKDEADMKQSKLHGLTNQRSLDTTLALLQTAAAQAEEDSEKVAEAMLNNEMSVDAFLEDFTSKRQLAHLRKIKAEKLYELMNNATTTTPGAYSVSPPSNWNYRR